ncbi:MAG: hypothetical protein C5B53_04565 [Candidatus Melainabacteria bacterium]|nr:MAG: hypothetical protein C5B53_04565 [Candidatus Melainabacteria bacterium]
MQPKTRNLPVALVTVMLALAVILTASVAVRSPSIRVMGLDPQTRAAFKCPKCGSDMEAGTLLSGGSYRCSWLRGPFRTWRNSEDVLTTMSFRCKECGYLESYATTK